jgi:hypothetical protein
MKSRVARGRTQLERILEGEAADDVAKAFREAHWRERVEDADGDAFALAR